MLTDCLTNKCWSRVSSWRILFLSRCRPSILNQTDTQRAQMFVFSISLNPSLPRRSACFFVRKIRGIYTAGARVCPFKTPPVACSSRVQNSTKLLLSLLPRHTFEPFFQRVGLSRPECLCLIAADFVETLPTIVRVNVCPKKRCCPGSRVVKLYPDKQWEPREVQFGSLPERENGALVNTPNFLPHFFSSLIQSILYSESSTK